MASSHITTASAARAPAIELPDPDGRPGSFVLIYDGHCRICQAQIRRLANWDRGGRLSFLSLHDPRTAQRYPDFSHDELMRNMVLVDPHGRSHAGAAAVRRLSRLLPRLYWLAPLLYIPGSLPLWQWGYRQIADRRYRWNGAEPCDDGSCSIHARK